MPSLFDDAERASLAEALAATNGTAELLGRSVVARQLPREYAEHEPFTGELDDSLGRHRCWDGGRPVPCQDGAKNGTLDKAKAGWQSLKDRMGAAWAKVPANARVPLEAAWHAGHYLLHQAEGTMRAGKALALEAARQRGLPEDHVERVGRWLGIADNVLAWTANMPATLAATGSLTLAKTSSFAPLASMAYVAQSTVRNPFATIRAARAVVGRLPAGVAASLKGHAEYAEATVAAAALEGFRRAGSADWYEALLYAALDATRDAAKAVALADAALLAQPTEPADDAPPSFDLGDAALVSSHAEPPFAAFEERGPLRPLAPESAVAYFRSLVPALGTDPQRFGEDMRRRAFTLAVSTDQVLTERVKSVLTRLMQRGVVYSGPNALTGPEAIQLLLDAAGVTPKNSGYACFLPGTLVEGDVLAASQAGYSGPAVEIETDDGRRLRVTVNHPVLTPGGWKRAGDVHEGENLVCYGDPVESLYAFLGRRRRNVLLLGVRPPRVPAASERRAVDHEKVPSRVEDVFQSLFEEGFPGLYVKRPVSPLDFHGDAMFFDDEVHCVGSDRVLIEGLYPDLLQASRQFGLMVGNVTATNTTCHREGLLNLRGFGNADSSPGGLRLANVPADGFRSLCGIGDAVPIRSYPVGPAADVNPRLFKSTDKRLGGDVDLAGDLVEGLPGLVTTHRVIKVERIWWTGHVYDLQTRTGFIISQGIITSNSMVFRTNMAESFAQGLDDERRAAGQERFPAWRYRHGDSAVPREHHLARNGLYYPGDVPFNAVRGSDINETANCLCWPEPVPADAWARLQRVGAKVETEWGQYAEREPFTGELDDSLGRHRCWYGGKPVPCPEGSGSLKMQQAIAANPKKAIGFLNHDYIDWSRRPEADKSAMVKALSQLPEKKLRAELDKTHAEWASYLKLHGFDPTATPEQKGTEYADLILGKQGLLKAALAAQAKPRG